MKWYSVIRRWIEVSLKCVLQFDGVSEFMKSIIAQRNIETKEKEQVELGKYSRY